MLSVEKRDFCWLKRASQEQKYRNQPKNWFRIGCYIVSSVGKVLVDGFQGKECDVIIFSVTRTTGSYRFLADTRRLNVALSRAKDQILIVGDVEYARENALLSEIVKYCTVKKINR